ncbi:response regulator [Blautia producta]|uniref:response regulator n=1 Tax=Blautia producta TaxID=33035 RepID=UPI0031B59C60
MIKVFLIDDERKIIALIERLVDWENLGLEVVGSANSGKKGLDSIIELKPDIVITDIRMPGIDGLEMIRCVRDMGLNVHFILISGHKHFEYAQSAIKYGVENYLLKPVNKQELVDNLVNVRDKILNEKDMMLEQVSMQSKVRIASGKMRKQFMSKIVNRERLNFDTWTELNQEYMLNLEKGNCQIVVAKADIKRSMEKEQVTIANHKICNMLQNELQKVCIEQEGIIHKGFMVFFVNYRNVDLKAELSKILEEQLFRFDEYCDITIGLSQMYDETVKDFDVLFQQSIESVRNRMFAGVNKVIEYVLPLEGDGVLFSSSDLDNLKKMIEIRDRDKIQTWLLQFLFRIREIHPGSKQLFREMGRIYELVRMSFYEHDTKFQFPIEKEQFEDMLNDVKSTGEIQETLKTFIWEVLDEYEAGVEHAEKRVMRTAKEYIAEHYAENISLETIAKEIFMNPVYFSVLFKKEEDINFSDYLTNYRIEKAKEFLKEEKYSVYEVGDLVGYKNPRYFSRVFQKIVGIKPSDFRKLYL